MKVVTLDAELEKSIVTSLTSGERGMYLALSPDVMQNIITQLSDEVKKFHELAQSPLVLTSQVVRVHFYRLIEQFFPSMRSVITSRFRPSVILLCKFRFP